MTAPDHRTILVFTVAPSAPTHEYLLLRRSRSRGGYWQAVTGSVEPGEALDDAAVRELRKATGLAPRRLLPVNYHYVLPGRRRVPASVPPGEQVTEHVFLALLSAKVDPTIDSAEHDAWDWYPFADALMWLRWPENIEGLRRCEGLLSPAPGGG